MGAQHNFEIQRERSKAYEIAFAHYLQTLGFFVLPTYDFSGKADDKAPRLKCGSRALVIPDLLAYSSEYVKQVWFEIKLKEQAAFHRNTKTDTTGFALRHYNAYREVKRLTGAPVYIVFIHQLERVVVYGEIDALPLSHRYEGNVMDRGGTIFFRFRDMRRLMTLSELNTYVEAR